MISLDEYVVKRNEAIIECWDNKSVEPMTQLLFENEELYVPGFKERWSKAEELVKWLTISYMTIEVTTMDSKYKKLASEFIKYYMSNKEV